VDTPPGKPENAPRSARARDSDVPRKASAPQKETPGTVQTGPPAGVSRPVLAAAVLLYLALGLLLIGHVADDSYISLRYARNLAEGHGLVWNVGERVPVEGYSNLLWVLMMALFLTLAPAHAMLLSQVVGLIAGLGCVLLTPRLARSWGAAPFGQGAAALFVGAAPSFAFWSVSGMETPAYALALLGGVLLLRERRAAYPAALVAAALLRPEGAYLFTFLWAWRLLSDVAARDRRAPLAQGLRGPLAAAFRDGLVFTVLYAPVLLWRFAHYGSLVANSVHAKFRPLAGLGWIVGDFAQYFAPHIAALVAVGAVASLAAVPRRDRVPLWLLPLAVALSLVNCRPAMSYYFRFFWPVLPLVFVATGLALEELRRRWVRNYALFAAALLLAYPVYGLVPITKTANAQDAIFDAVLRPLAAWMRERPGGGTLAMSDCGLVPYESRANVLDLWGLNDIEIARDGFRVDRVLARAPDVVALVSTRAGEFRPLFAWEQSLAQSAGFARAYRRSRVLSAPAPIEYHMWVFERVPAP
jgi:hypothetical protein